jgi:ABC-type sugar transport system substrate-binding protein
MAKVTAVTLISPMIGAVNEPDDWEATMMQRDHGLLGTPGSSATATKVLDGHMSRRDFIRRGAAFGMVVPSIAAALNAVSLRTTKGQEVGCPEATPEPAAAGTPLPQSGQKIGVTVAYLSVPFYANFKTGLADGARMYGFEYDLRDGQGDLATELANIQDFIAQKVDLILLTPSGEGIIPGIEQANDAGIPVIEVNNRAGFASDMVDVVTYVGADDREFGRLQAKLLDDTFKGQPTKIGYVLGIPGTSPQILRAEGFDEVIDQHNEYEVVARVTDDFDSAKALAVTQDLLSRFPKGQLDVIVMQGPEGVAAADFARKSGRAEVKFILGDYPADVRQAIIDGYVTGTVNQDPYPQAFQGMHMARLYLDGRVDDIPTPYFLPLPIITQENAEEVPPAWGC